VIEPAGMTLSLTSPLGVLMTTAERLPIKALETGTIFFVSLEFKLKTLESKKVTDRHTTIRAVLLNLTEK